MFCGNASVSEDKLIEAVIEALKKNLKDLSVSVSNQTDDEDKKRKHNEYVSLIESKLYEIEKKELSLWEKYAEESMPKAVFDTLIGKCTSEKKSLENALKMAQNDMPQTTDYENAVISLRKAIDALSDPSVSASTKNNLLSAVVEKIIYHRPKAVRMSKEDADAQGIDLKGGWYCPDFSIDIIRKY